MIYAGMRLAASRLYSQGQVNRLYPDVETLHAESLAFAHEVAKQDPLPLRQRLLRGGCARSDYCEPHAQSDDNEPKNGN